MFLSRVPRNKSDRAITFVSGSKKREQITGLDDVLINVGKTLEKVGISKDQRMLFREKLEKAVPNTEHLNPEMLSAVYILSRKLKEYPDEDLRQARDLASRLREFFDDREANIQLFSTFYNTSDVEKDLRGYQENMLRYIRYLLKYINL